MKKYTSTYILVLFMCLLAFLVVRSRSAQNIVYSIIKLTRESDEQKERRYRTVMDPAVCAGASGSVMVSSDLAEFSKEYCYRSLAKNLGDAKWCTGIFFDSAFDCIKDIAVATKDRHQCLQITNVPSSDTVPNFRERQKNAQTNCEMAVKMTIEAKR